MRQTSFAQISKIAKSQRRKERQAENKKRGRDQDEEDGTSGQHMEVLLVHRTVATTGMEDERVAMFACTNLQ